MENATTIVPIPRLSISTITYIAFTQQLHWIDHTAPILSPQMTCVISIMLRVAVELKSNINSLVLQLGTQWRIIAVCRLVFRTKNSAI